MTDAFEKEINPEGVTRADLVVGIPSYNEADAIAYPVAQADTGLRQYFSDLETVIINCDNNSPDNTRQVFLDTETRTPKIYLSTEPGVKGKGNNLRNLFQKAVELEARAVVVVDADLKSITPEWIRNLATPLFKGFSYVAPLYVRHKYDGTITNGVAYPMTRALYGRRVRQPIGGDFGFSGKLAQAYLESTTWNESVSHFGIDIWMTTLAINRQARICQAFMGRPKIHRAKDPASDLGPMFRQVVGTMFGLMEEFEPAWMGIKYSRPTAIFGFGVGEVDVPPKVDVDTDHLMVQFQHGLARFGPVWERVLTPDVCGKLQEIGGLQENEFDFPTDLWARVLFDTAVSYAMRDMARDELMDSLVPLYFGRTLSFVRRTRKMSIKQAEAAVENDCETFELTKPYLIQQWNKRRAKESDTDKLNP